MRVAFEIGREARASAEDPRVPVSVENFWGYFTGLEMNNALPAVTLTSALTVPAVAAAVTFLSRTMATLPLHAFTMKDGSAERVTGGIEDVIAGAWTPQDGSYRARVYFWRQVFSNGRGLAWIERDGREIVNIWPLDPSKVRVRRRNFERYYAYGGREYAAADIIDLPFLLRDDQLAHYGPISLGSKAIQLALAMNDYAGQFFAGGGVPPLALVGPMPAGPDAVKRAQDDIRRAIDAARQRSEVAFPIPPGYELKPVGFDPDKGQMTEARLFQVQEIARVWQMPPAFLQDLSRGTFANVEQQDLNLVKHLVGQWAEAFEDEINLKVYGRGNRDGFIEHNLDGLMRGDFKSRIESLARAIQTAQLTPNEARKLDNRPRHDNAAADELLVQGATVVLGTATSATPAPDGGANSDGNGDNNGQA